MNYINKVREFVIENFLFGDASRINDDVSFIETGIIDSTGILELVAFLEETYGIVFEDDEIVPENLNSLRNIESFLCMKLDGKWQAQ